MDKNIFPGWEIVEPIGAGGFSKVYKIKKCNSGRTEFFSALKIIEIPQSEEDYRSYRSEGYSNQMLTQIFNEQVDDIVREFEMMHQFRGVANIVSFEDHLVVQKEDKVGWRVLIRMELLKTLLDWYVTKDFSDNEVKQLGIDICNALMLCEQKKIVHRDIKPQNIFVNDFGNFKLGDFGVAKVMDHTTHATKIGTYSYMAPEVFNNQPYSASSDIYSLGLTLYWLLNERRLPFVPLPPAVPTPSVNNEAQTKRLSGEEIPAPKYGSDELKAVVLKACAFNPKDRFSTAEEFLNALNSVSTNGELCNALARAEEQINKIEEKSLSVDDDDETWRVNNKPASQPTSEADDDDKTHAVPRATKAPEAEITPEIDDEDKTHAVKRAPKAPEGNIETPSFTDKKSGKGKIIAIAAALLVVIAAASTIFILSRNDDDNTDKESSTESHISEISSITESIDPESSEVEFSESPEIAFSEGLKYTLLEDGTYEVSGIGSCTDTEIVIPSIYDKKAVTSIGDGAFLACDHLTRVTLPDGVKTINDWAFGNCTSLKSVTLPNSVTNIGDRAFKNCNALESINIPNGVTIIGNEVFAYCTSLESIEIPNSITSIGDYAFSCCESLTNIAIPNSVTNIGSCAFEYCTSLTNVTIRNGVINIGVGAFWVCESLESITIPDSVTSVGEEAFFGCDSLSDIYCEASSKPNSWSDDWLGNCTATVYWNGKAESSKPEIAFSEGLEYTLLDNGTYKVSGIGSCTDKDIIIPAEYNGKAVTFIGGSAFEDCSSLTSIKIPNSVTSIGNYAFKNCDSLTSIEIPNSVTSISNKAFYSCESLTSIEIPNSVTSIGAWAFAWCESLTSIEIPNSVTKIGNGAFEYCTSLTSIEIPNSVTFIGEGAFCDCSSLTDIYCEASSKPGDWHDDWLGNCTATVYWNGKTETSEPEISEPESPEEHFSEGLKFRLGDNGCYEVIDIGSCTDTEIIIPSQHNDVAVTHIGDYAFDRCSSITSVKIPNSVLFIGEWAFNDCTSLTSIEIPNSITTISISAFRGCESLKNIKIPNSVTSISEYAFLSCSSLTSIEIPNSVTSIGDFAFDSCASLTSIEIPNSVTSIGEGIVGTCNVLTSITVAEGNPVYHSKNNCIIETGTKTLVAGCNTSKIPNDGSITAIGDYAFSWCLSLISIEIPNGVTTIGEGAFDSCSSLRNIVIPNSLTAIGGYAFANCDSLTSITIPNNVTTIGERAFDSCSSLLSIEIPNSVTTIGAYAFSGCSSLTSITIPNSVTSIDAYAFSGCSSLTSIEIPNSVTSIDWGAFEHCFSLTDIYCKSSSKPTGWNDNWLSGCDATVHWGS